MVKRVMLEVRHGDATSRNFAAGVRPLSTDLMNPSSNHGAAAGPSGLVLPGFRLDQGFAGVSLPPSARAAGSLTALSMGGSSNETVLVRGEVEEGDLEEFLKGAEANPEVVGVFADPAIEPCPVCPGSPALGSTLDVARLLGVERLRAAGMDGTGVTVAIVDTGINLAHLRARGLSPRLDVARSWSPPGASGSAGAWPVDHGTMCAYDAMIAAPNCTLLDVALLRSTRSGATIMEGFLSDAVLAFSHLLAIMRAPRRPGENRSLVVNNSWGMFNPSWDFPVGHAGNYSDNPNHPFNRIVKTLERAGADILFAAGNCGADCPDGRCGGVTSRTIYGANSHASVLCVAGVDVKGVRAGYSSQGPGRLSKRKPDICGFTHFDGSGVYPADGGTSAATPVVAGVVAAIRTRFPYIIGDSARTPARLRRWVRATALDVGASGFDHNHGYGIIHGRRLAAALSLSAEPTTASLVANFEASADQPPNLTHVPEEED